MPLSARARSLGSASQTSARSSATRSPPGRARTRLDKGWAPSSGGRAFRPGSARGGTSTARSPRPPLRARSTSASAAEASAATTAAAPGVRVPDAFPPGEHVPRRPVRGPWRARRGRPPFLDLAHPFLDSPEVELGQPGPKACDLPAQLLRAFGGARLQRERPEPRLHLGLEVARTLDLHLHARQLELRPVPALLELP